MSEHHAAFEETIIEEHDPAKETVPSLKVRKHFLRDLQLVMGQTIEYGKSLDVDPAETVVIITATMADGIGANMEAMVGGSKVLAKTILAAMRERAWEMYEACSDGMAKEENK